MDARVFTCSTEYVLFPFCCLACCQKASEDGELNVQRHPACDRCQPAEWAAASRRDAPGQAADRWLQLIRRVGVSESCVTRYLPPMCLQDASVSSHERCALHCGKTYQAFLSSSSVELLGDGKQHVGACRHPAYSCQWARKQLSWPHGGSCATRILFLDMLYYKNSSVYTHSVCLKRCTKSWNILCRYIS